MPQSSLEAKGALLRTLTERELQIVKRLVGGLTNSQVGAELGLSGRTVEVHRRTIVLKLGTLSAVELGYFVGLAVAGGTAPAQLQ